MIRQKRLENRYNEKQDSPLENQVMRGSSNDIMRSSNRKQVIGNKEENKNKR